MLLGLLAGSRLLKLDGSCHKVSEGIFNRVVGFV